MQVRVLGHTSLLISCRGLHLLTDPLPVPVRPAPDYVVVSHGHGDHVRGLRLYPGVPRIGSRAVAFRPGDIAVVPWQELDLGPLRLVALPAPGHPHLLQRLPGYDFLLSLFAPGSGVRRCGESLGYVFDDGATRVWWTGDMRWDRDFVESVVAQFRPDAVYVHVQPWDLGWFNLLVPVRKLAKLRGFVPVVVPVHVPWRTSP